MSMSETAASEVFEQQRPLLFGIAYRMLGSAVEAEDVVQDAWLRWCTTTPDAVQSPRAWLSTVVTRLCLDQLKAARRQREQYIGPWLPEPLPTAGLALPDPAAERVDRHESISLAFLVLLERLSPVERAVFLLHEVFEYPFAEVARIVDRPEATCRQLFRRAKAHLVEARPRFPSSRTAERQLVECFVRACAAGDMEGLLEMLQADVVAWSDGGGRKRAALRPIHGREAVARLMFGLTRKEGTNLEVALSEVNGQLAIVGRQAGQVVIVLSLEADDTHIHALRFVVNPDKLTRWQADSAGGGAGPPPPDEP